MIIDCATCVAPRIATAHPCGDCVMSVLLRVPAGRAGPEAPVADAVELDGAEHAALAALADAGLVPPLRLVLPLASPFERQQSAS